MANMSAKFDQEGQNGLVVNVFTRLFPYMSIVTLTFDLWLSKSIGFILSPWQTCLPSLIKKHITVYLLSCSQAYFHICPLWPWPLTCDLRNQCSQGPCTDGTTDALQYPHRNPLRGDNKDLIWIATFSVLVCDSKFKIKISRSKFIVWCKRSCHKEYTFEIWKPNFQSS